MYICFNVLSAQTYDIKETTDKPETDKDEKIYVSPLWLLVVTDIVLVFVPPQIGKIIEEIIDSSLREEMKTYMNDKPAFMRCWTNELINVSLTKEKIKRFVFEYYLTLFKKRIFVLFTDNLPKMIDANAVLMDDIINNRKKSQDVLEEFQHLQRRANEIKAEIRLFQVQYLDENSISVHDLQKVKHIGHGKFSEVFLARYKLDNKTMNVALKVMKINVSYSVMMARLTEVEYLRYLFIINICVKDKAC